MAGDDRFKVLIAGGGVAGVEALLALRDLLGSRARIELLSGGREFVYRPLALAEPFGLGGARRLELDKLAAEHVVPFRQDLLSAVNPGRRTALTESGLELEYDALLLAVGVRPVPELPGALTYSGPEANEAYRDLLSAVEDGEVKRLVFAAPATVRWALPLYELALLTAHHVSERGLANVELTVVTSEVEPLEMFGHRASEPVARLLADAGIQFRGSTAPSAVEGRGLVVASGERVLADRVVALPRLEVPPIPGVPQGPRGFIGTDPYMQVDGLTRVYAAGDATWFPVKQGGLATQQADVAATSIASCVDASIAKVPFRPVLRGALLTGTAPRYLRSVIGDRTGSSASGVVPLWWPPSKIAARHLAPYLARGDDPDPPPMLDDLPPLHGEDPAETADEHQEAVELALAAADADARWHDYRTALRWLNVAEQLNLTLPPSHAVKREEWSAALKGSELSGD
ncbi:MAG: FAD-dependent oxidoreductase [Actinomycetota bacterium]